MPMTEQQLEEVRQRLREKSSQMKDATSSQVVEDAKTRLRMSPGYIAAKNTLDDLEKPVSIGQRIGQGLQRMKESVGGRVEQIKKNVEMGKDAGGLRTAFRVGGEIAGGVGDVIGEGLMTAGSIGKKILTTQEQEAEIDKTIRDAFTKVSETSAGKWGLGLLEKYEELKKTDPAKAADISALLGFADLATNLIGGGAAKKVVTEGAEGVVRTGKEFAKVGAEMAEEAAKGVAKTAQDVAKSPVIGTIKAQAERVGEKLAQIPERAKTITETAQETAKLLDESPPVVRRAATAGLEPRTAKKIAEAPKEMKDVFRQMKNDADEFVAGNTNKNPSATAGSFFTKRIKEGDELRKKLGERLGKITEKFNDQVVPAKQKVLARLQKVPGLKKLKIDNKGNLDFSGTTLTTKATQADRAVINDFYKAIKGRDATGLHQLRQEIFEVLGGKKKASVAFTETQDKAAEAIRDGLADALESISKEYRVVNRQYAKIAEPLKNLRKFYNKLEDAADDLVDENSALLLRRFTSNAKSGPELKNYMNQIDKALSAVGKKSNISLEDLQDFQNTLEEFYPELIKKTGLAGQTGLGLKLTKGKGLGGLVESTLDAAGKFTEITPEFQRKILGELLE